MFFDGEKMEIKSFVAMFLLGFSAASVHAQSCANRGDLEAPYCDANNDLVADTPAKTVHPKPLVVGIGNVEDVMTATKIYNPLLAHLSSCLKQEVMLHPVVGEGAMMEAMRHGKVHVAQFSTGSMGYAVHFAGAVPFAGKGVEKLNKRDSYTLVLIVPAKGPARKPTDLVGKKIAHASETSNSGNIAPRVLFPEIGLEPDKGYKVEFSGKHENSIRGVALGLYDGAAVASDILERMIASGEIKRDQIRVVYESDPFPTDAFAMAHDVDPKLASGIRQCFAEFKFPESMARLLEGNNRFFPVNYAPDWRLVRMIAKASGRHIDQAGYQKIVNAKK